MGMLHFFFSLHFLLAFLSVVSTFMVFFIAKEMIEKDLSCSVVWGVAMVLFFVGGGDCGIWCVNFLNSENGQKYLNI